MSSKLPNPSTYAADLHMHSTCSDGRLSPEDLVTLVASSGVRTMALTDHDTVAGVERARAACEVHGVDFISGIELTVNWGREVHLLGYFLDPNHAALQNGLKERALARIERVREICHRLDRLGYVVYPDQIIKKSGVTVGRPHIARALVEAGHVRTEEEAFTRFLRNGGKAYVPTAPLKLETGIQWSSCRSSTEHLDHCTERRVRAGFETRPYSGVHHRNDDPQSRHRRPT